VTSRDGTILAGHGVVEAAKAAGLEHVPVVRLDLDADDPRALKVLTGDNEIARLAAIDDRALADLLRDIRDTDLTGLLGTGYDDAMLANLVYVTRPRGEIGDRDDAAAWVGLPGYDGRDQRIQLIVTFDTAEDRTAFLEMIGAGTVYQPQRDGALTTRWPPQHAEDPGALRFDHAS
jgi:hypothetical protein